MSSGASVVTTAMRTRCRSAREVLARHPWATPLMETRTTPGPATLRHHDAVLLDRDGNVSECSFTSILVFDDDRLILPDSPDALQGITAGVMAEICRDLGMQVEQRSVAPGELTSGAVICVCNALLGPFPVTRIGTKDVPVFPAEGMHPLRQAWMDFT